MFTIESVELNSDVRRKYEGFAEGLDPPPTVLPHRTKATAFHETNSGSVRQMPSVR
jgi:hypothetical protein